MDSAALFSEDGKGFGYGGVNCDFDKGEHVLCNTDGLTQGVCPVGWHLPNPYDWEKLYELGNFSNYHLKSKDNWDDNLAGTDDYGFGALPSGYVYLQLMADFQLEIVFSMAGRDTEFWRRGISSDGSVAYFSMEEFIAFNAEKMALPARCIKDE